MKAGEESFETIPEYKSSVEKMIQLLDYANEDSLALGYDQAVNDFANGEGWMFLQGSWTLPSFLSANPDFNVEFTILPNDNGKPIATQAVDTGFCVNAKIADELEKIPCKRSDIFRNRTSILVSFAAFAGSTSWKPAKSSRSFMASFL